MEVPAGRFDERAAPTYLGADNGPEVAAVAIKLCLARCGLKGSSKNSGQKASHRQPKN
jgi:hypothetical protein